MIKTNVMRILESAHIPFMAYEYDTQRGIDALSVARDLNKDSKRIFKTLVTFNLNHDYFVFVVPADCVLNLKQAAVAAGVKSLEMLPQKRLFPITGYVHGGCSPIGMKKSFPTFIDSSALAFDSFCVSGGKVGVTIELNPKELAQFIDAKFAPFAN